MTSRRHVVLGGIAALLGPGLSESAMSAASQETFEIVKSDEQWRRQLSKEQYAVLREHGTERAGTSPLDKEYRPGTYLCAACDLPLYSSNTKFDSGTGWPSFWAPIEGAIGTSEDRSLPALRRAPRPRVQRRPAADRAALLHERRRAQVRACLLNEP